MPKVSPAGKKTITSNPEKGGFKPNRNEDDSEDDEENNSRNDKKDGINEASTEEDESDEEDSEELEDGGVWTPASEMGLPGSVGDSRDGP